MQKQNKPHAPAGMPGLDETHDPALESFVAAANDPETDFPIQNLPFAVFRRRGGAQDFRVGVGIGDQILDVQAVGHLLDDTSHAAASACGQPTMIRLMELGAAHWSALRLALSRLLRKASPHAAECSAHLVPMNEAEYALPAKIPNFSDFVASMHHIGKVIRAKRPESPDLPPNYVWTPLAYHGRASTIRPSGHSFLRPKGQTGKLEEGRPVYGATAALDYEAELGIYVAKSTADGQTLTVDEAEQAIFGLSVLNDWTARDIQGWEQFPLGPFQSKSFTTTISPWVVTLDALEPFRRPFERDPSFPAPEPHLESAAHRARGVFDVNLDILLQTEHMAREGIAAALLGRSNVTDLYWSIPQIVAHQTANGCSLEAGDLIGTGTVSGPALEESGCMMELSQAGKSPFRLASGESRSFVGDGDTLTVRAFCDAEGFRRIGFGNATATVLPAA